MANKDLFIERREEKGDYAVKRASVHQPIATAKTQEKAIEKAARIDPDATILVERVRNTNVGRRDKWRKP